VRTGFELLDAAPSAPLSAILTARPVRACVFVPAVEGVPWERLIEHALAAQIRVWGGASNLIVPTGWEIAADEIFWRLVDLFDPDVVGLHAFAYADVEEIAPDRYAESVRQVDEELTELGFSSDARENEIAGLRDRPFWTLEELSDGLRSKLVQRLAPLHQDEIAPRDVYITGPAPPAYPLTDVLSLDEVPESVLDIKTTLGDLDQLRLTHAVGRLLPSLKQALEERDVAVNEVVIGHQPLLRGHMWPRSVRQDYMYPQSLPLAGLARRLSLDDRDRLIVVVGDEPRDFLLFHGLSRLRPFVHWLPAARLDDESWVTEFGEEVHQAARYAGSVVAVTSATNHDAADAAVERLGNASAPVGEISRVDWQDVLPRSSMRDADPKSEGRSSLLRHEGETQELQTPTPVSVSLRTADDLSKLCWMVDVEVQGWRPARHPSQGAQILRVHLSRVTRLARAGWDPRTSARPPSFKPSLGWKVRLRDPDFDPAQSSNRSPMSCSLWAGRCLSQTRGLTRSRALVCSAASRNWQALSDLKRLARCWTRT
jgi:hypothetical protein